METAVTQQFLNFFQDFISLCQLNWPVNTTTESEIKNAFATALHIEKCLDKLQQRDLISDFLSTLNIDDESNILLKNCFSNPSKYILKKIIRSDTKIDIVDMGIRLFIEIFDEHKLENCLTDLMVETASTETLLKNLHTELPKEKILQLKSKVFLSHISSSDDCKESVIKLLSPGTEDIIQLLVLSINNVDIRYRKGVSCIIECFLNIMLDRSESRQRFWKSLLNVEENYLINMCIEHNDLFTYITEAILDCGKLIYENISADLFYINLNYDELKSIVHRITKYNVLKQNFLSIIKESNTDLKFWEDIML